MSKAVSKPPKPMRGGMPICFPQLSSGGMPSELLHLIAASHLFVGLLLQWAAGWLLLQRATGGRLLQRVGRCCSRQWVGCCVQRVGRCYSESAALIKGVNQVLCCS